MLRIINKTNIKEGCYTYNTGHCTVVGIPHQKHNSYEELALKIYGKLKL